MPKYCPMCNTWHTEDEPCYNAWHELCGCLASDCPLCNLHYIQSNPILDSDFDKGFLYAVGVSWEGDNRPNA